MASRVRWGPIPRVAVIAVLPPILCLAAYVPIQQRILRSRAERLLADIRQIQMGKSTWADAQRLIYRWGKWGGYEGSCTAQRCHYQIAMEDTFRVLPAIFVPSADPLIKPRECCRWLWKPYFSLGGRFGLVAARIEVKNGIIWTKSFDVVVGNWDRPDPKSAPYFDPLVVGANGRTHLGEFSPNHPEYWMNTVQCTVCVLMMTRFTPHIDEKTLQKLFDLHLDCLTRWKECKTQQDIAPAAYALAMKDQESTPTTAFNATACQMPLEIVAREAHYVAIASVDSIVEKRNWARPVPAASFRSIESLKNNAYVGPLLFRDQLALRPDMILPGSIPASKLRTGEKVILLFDHGPDEHFATDFMDACSVIPYSPESRASVQRGIALDAIPERY